MANQAPQIKNLAIWVQVDKTDPSFTKPFSRGGGFKGTAINATYLARRATEVFGPMGIGWGLEILDESLLEGAWLDERNREVVHRLRVKLWYKWGNERGEVVHFGQTVFVGKNKFGAFTDEEAPKKSLTDAMSKCLSMLGFGADVHLGQYDDHKYVAAVKEEIAEAKRQSTPKISDEQATELGDLLIESGAKQKAFLDFFKVKQIVDLPVSDYERAKTLLLKKKQEAA